MEGFRQRVKARQMRPRGGTLQQLFLPLVPNEKGAPYLAPLGRLQGLARAALVMASDSLIDPPALVVSTASLKRRYEQGFEGARSPLGAAWRPARLALLTPELQGLSPAQLPA